MAAVKPKARTDYVVSLVDEALLRELYQFHFLTAKQLTRLRYSSKSLNYVREQLKRLTDAGYVWRTNLPRSSSQGRAESAYELAPPAIKYLTRRGFDLSARPRPVLRATGDQFLLHTLAGNDVLIAARLLATQVTGLELPVIRHERDLRHAAAITVTTPRTGGVSEEEKVFVVPDGWLDFRIQKPDGGFRQFPIWLEVDRATEAVRSFKRKLRGIVAYYDQHHYSRLFGTKYIRVGIAIDESAASTFGQGAARRRDAVVRWIEEDLQLLGKKTYGSVFAVTVLPAGDAIDPRLFFMSPHWLQPFSATPISLLDLPESASTH